MANRGLQFYAEPESFADMARAMEVIFDETDRSAAEVLEFAAVRFGIAGKAGTKTAKKTAKRDIIRIAQPPSRKRDRRRAQWGAVRLHQTKPKKLLKIWTAARGQAGKREAMRSPIAQVPHKRAAKNSWNGMLKKFMASVSQSGYSKTSKVSGAKKRLKGTKKAINLFNKLMYLLKIHPKIEDEAGRKAAKTMLIGIERGFDRAIKKGGWK